MRKGAVRLRHFVSVFAFFNGGALSVIGVHQLGGVRAFDEIEPTISALAAENDR